MKPPNSKQWITSAKWDLLWIFNSFWLLILIIVFYLSGYFSILNSLLYLISTKILSTAHLIIPIVSVFLLPSLLKAFGKEKFRYIFLPILLLSVPTILLLFMHFNIYYIGINKNLFVLLTFIYLIWNQWHFSSQNFGILNIYRMRNNQNNRSTRFFDNTFVRLHSLILIPLLYFPHLIKVWNQLNIFIIPKLIEFKPNVLIITASIISTVMYLIYEILKSNIISTPRILFIIMICLQTVFSAISFNIFFWYIIGLNHWMVDIAIVSKVTTYNKKSVSSSRTNKFYLFIILILVAGFLINYFHEKYFSKELHKMILEGKILQLNQETMTIQFIVTMGLFYSLNYLHMLYDRCLFKLNRTETEVVLEALKN